MTKSTGLASSSGDAMNASRAADVLKQHNMWRRGEIEESPDAVNPKLIGQAIDFAVTVLQESPPHMAAAHLLEAANRLAARGFFAETTCADSDTDPEADHG